MREETSVPTKRQFDLVLIMLLLWQPATGLAKAWLARHSRVQEGEAQTAAAAALFVL